MLYKITAFCRVQKGPVSEDDIGGGLNIQIQLPVIWFTDFG